MDRENIVTFRSRNEVQYSIEQISDSIMDTYLREKFSIKVSKIVGDELVPLGVVTKLLLIESDIIADLKSSIGPLSEYMWYGYVQNGGRESLVRALLSNDSEIDEVLDILKKLDS